MPDFSQFSTKKKASEGVKMTVVHPATGEPIIDEPTGQPVTITLIGADSDEYKKIQHGYSNQQLAKMAKRGKIPTLTAEAIEAQALDLLVKCTKDWTGISFGGTEPLPCTEENIRKLYTSVPWIRDQAADFVAERQNFLGN